MARVSACGAPDLGQDLVLPSVPEMDRASATGGRDEAADQAVKAVLLSVAAVIDPTGWLIGEKEEAGVQEINAVIARLAAPAVHTLITDVLASPLGEVERVATDITAVDSPADIIIAITARSPDVMIDVAGIAIMVTIEVGSVAGTITAIMGR